MSNGSLAKRYTRALFSLSEEANAVEQYNTELQTLIEVLELNNGELLNALTTPVFKIEERK
jgi:F0F1-type ATP synthase delta subunit